MPSNAEVLCSAFKRLSRINRLLHWERKTFERRSAEIDIKWKAVYPTVAPRELNWDSFELDYYDGIII